MSGVQNKPGKGGRDQDKQVHGSHANGFALYPRSRGESQAVAPAHKLRDVEDCPREWAVEMGTVDVSGNYLGSKIKKV